MVDAGDDEQDSDTTQREEPDNTPKTGKGSRPARATGRTVAFGTRLSEDFIWRMKEIALRDRLKLAELLERAIEAYEREQSAKKQVS